MIAGFAGLLVCQLVGEILVRTLFLPLPGPVAGFGLMFGFLVWRGQNRTGEADGVPVELGRVCDALLRNLALLFVPAATGVVQYLGLLRDHALAISIAVVFSTLATLLATVATFRTVARAQAYGRAARAKGRAGPSDGAEP